MKIRLGNKFFYEKKEDQELENSKKQIKNPIFNFIIFSSLKLNSHQREKKLILLKLNLNVISTHDINNFLQLLKYQFSVLAILHHQFLNQILKKKIIPPNLINKNYLFLLSCELQLNLDSFPLEFQVLDSVGINDPFLLQYLLIEINEILQCDE